MIPETKEFDGIVYHYENDYPSKRRAQNQAWFLRRESYFARVVQRQGRYVLYVRDGNDL